MSMLNRYSFSRPGVPLQISSYLNILRCWIDLDPMKWQLIMPSSGHRTSAASLSRSSSYYVLNLVTISPKTPIHAQNIFWAQGRKWLSRLKTIGRGEEFTDLCHTLESKPGALLFCFCTNQSSSTFNLRKTNILQLSLIKKSVLISSRYPLFFIQT